MSWVAGIDFSTHAIDVVLIDENDEQAPRWFRYEIRHNGDTAFDRTRAVAGWIHKGIWDDVLAVGIEDPRGQNAGALYRVQGAILMRLPSDVLVQPWIPSQWRKAVGLPGNCSKDAVQDFASLHAGAFTSPQKLFDKSPPQDMYDAYCIALATRQALTRKEAA